MGSKEQTVTFLSEDGEKIEFEVIEETTFMGEKYLLVAEEDSEYAHILRQTILNDDEITYEEIEDESELEALEIVFQELLEDIEIQ